MNVANVTTDKCSLCVMAEITFIEGARGNGSNFGWLYLP